MTDKLEMYAKHLREQGFTPRIQDDAVAFEHEGGLYVMPRESDDRYLRVLFPEFWSLDSDEERTRAYAAACEVTAALKAVKVFPLGDNTWASVELFLARPEDFRAVLPRCLSALQAATRQFAARMGGAGAGAGLLDLLRRMLGLDSTPAEPRRN